METLTNSQLKTLSQFFISMAVVWFAAAFITTKEPISGIQYITSGIISLLLALKLSERIE